MDQPNSHVPDWVVQLEGDNLVEELESNIRGVSESKAESLVDEYRNLPTLCWAAIYDREHLQEQHQIKGEYLTDQLTENDLHISYFGERLYIPERVPDWKVDIPLKSYGGRYDFHQENMEEWYKTEVDSNMKTGEGGCTD